MVAKGVVTALVCDDPNACEDATLDEIVDGPKEERERVREDVYVSNGDIV